MQALRERWTCTLGEHPLMGAVLHRMQAGEQRRMARHSPAAGADGLVEPASLLGEVV
jgi:hypothetical protein